MTILPDQPQSIGRVLDSGIKLFRSAWKQAFVLALIRGTGWGLLFGAIGFSVLDRTGGLDRDDPTMILGVLPGLATDFALFFILALLISAWISTATIVLMNTAANGGKKSLKTLLQDGLARTLHYAGGYFMYVLILGLVAVGFSFVGSLLATVTGIPAMSIIALLLAVIPATWLSIALILFDYFIVVENEGIFKSLKLSRALVGGHWWRTMAVVSVVYLVFILLYFALSFVSELAFAFTLPAAGAENLSAGLFLNMMIGVVVDSLIVAALSPVVPAMVYVQYRDLKKRKGGSDLADRIKLFASG